MRSTPPQSRSASSSGNTAQPAHHLALMRDRKHPRQKIGNNEWIPLIGDAFEVIMQQPRYPVPPEYTEKRKADPKAPPHGNDYIFRFDKGSASTYFKQACDANGSEAAQAPYRHRACESRQ